MSYKEDTLSIAKYALAWLETEQLPYYALPHYIRQAKAHLQAVILRFEDGLNDSLAREEAARERGFDQGHVEGYGVGYDEGHRQGCKDSY